MALAHGGGLGGNRFLFEIRPDVFPCGFLSPVEIQLWEKYYRDLKKRTPKNGK